MGSPISLPVPWRGTIHGAVQERGIREIARLTDGKQAVDDSVGRADVTASLILLAKICCSKQSSGREAGWGHAVEVLSV